ncbi:MAG: hypothetical protein ACP5KW_09275 [Thermoproteota archaeon]
MELSLKTLEAVKKQRNISTIAKDHTTTYLQVRQKKINFNDISKDYKEAVDYINGKATRNMLYFSTKE